MVIIIRIKILFKICKCYTTIYTDWCRDMLLVQPSTVAAKEVLFITFLNKNQDADHNESGGIWLQYVPNWEVHSMSA